MAARTITTKLAIECEAECSAAIRSINAELRLYQSELEKVEAEHQSDANSVDALAAKYSALLHEQQAALLK